MKYIFVDKNFLIPIITEFSYNSALNNLINSIINKNDCYIKNTYIVITNNNIFYGLIFAKNNFIYEKINKNNIANETKLFNYTTLNLNYTFNNSTTINNYFDFELIINNKTNIVDNCGIQCISDAPNIQKVDELFNNKIDDNQNNGINHIKDVMVTEQENKKITVLKYCEEVNELYKLEEHKIKRLELNLKSLNNKIEKLKKHQNDKIFDNLLKLKNDYKTWKKLKYNRIESTCADNESSLDYHSTLSSTDEYKSGSLSQAPDSQRIPIIFLSKYNYFDKITMENNSDLSNLLTLLNDLDIEKVFIDNNLNNINDIIKFSKKYTEICKTLHYKFDHDWDYLEQTEAD
jgi:hypothetical protein